MSSDERMKAAIAKFGKGVTGHWKKATLTLHDSDARSKQSTRARRFSGAEDQQCPTLSRINWSTALGCEVRLH